MQDVQVQGFVPAALQDALFRVNLRQQITQGGGCLRGDLGSGRFLGGGQELQEHTLQLVEVHRLSEIFVEALIHQFLPHAGDGVRRQHNDLAVTACTVEVGECADLPHGFYAVHAGHHLIHEYEIVVLAAAELDGILTAGGSVHL